MQIKTEISPHNSQNGSYEKENKTSIGKDVEKWNPHELFCGNINSGETTVEYNMEILKN